MAKAALLPHGPGYDGPPESLRAIDYELYQYLWLIHQQIFGTVDAPGGSLDNENLDLSNIAVDHGQASGLGDDDHTQYLNTARHAAVRNNPHQVGAVDVGRDEAQWNASSLQGQPLPEAIPGNQQILQYNSVTQEWALAELPTPSGGDSFSSFEFTFLLPSGTGVLVASGFLPANALIMGVFATNPEAFTGPLFYSIGIDGKTDAWGINGVANGDSTDVGVFTLNSPIYTDDTGMDLHLTPIGGNWGANNNVTVKVVYWLKPA